MFFLIQEDNALVQISGLRNRFPHVGFSDSPDSAFLATLGVVPVEQLARPEIANGKRGVQRAPEQREDGTWFQAWDVVDIPQVELDHALAQARNNAWLKIKAERDDRKLNGGVKVTHNGVDHWFHTDVETRTQLTIIDTKAIRAGWPESTVVHPKWKTMQKDASGEPIYVPMTIELLRKVLDTGMDNEGAIFNCAEAHLAAVGLSADPDKYDYSDNWPERYEPT